MGAAIQLRGIGKAFYGQKVLESIDLQVEEGRFYLLAGANGVGKSTLMRVLVRQERFDQGDGHVLGFALHGDAPEQCARVAYVSEAIEYALPLSLGEIFARFPRIHPHWDASLFHQIQAELGFDLSKRHSDLSRGQKMQVAVAAAFAIRPKLLLLDEITSVLDARARDVVVERLRAAVREGATVVLATNIVTEAQHVADHLLILDQGKLCLDSPISEISSHFIRLRRSSAVSHSVFHDPGCIQLGTHPDGTRRYIASRTLVAAAHLPADLIDPSPVTAEEAFIFFVQRKQG